MAPLVSPSAWVEVEGLHLTSVNSLDLQVGAVQPLIRLVANNQSRVVRQRRKMKAIAFGTEKRSSSRLATAANSTAVPADTKAPPALPVRPRNEAASSSPKRFSLSWNHGTHPVSC